MNEYPCMGETKWDCDDCHFPSICGLRPYRYTVIIEEEHDPNRRLCYGSWPTMNKQRGECKELCYDWAMHCRAAYNEGVWKKMKRGCPIDEGLVVIVHEDDE